MTISDKLSHVPGSGSGSTLLIPGSAPLVIWTIAGKPLIESYALSDELGYVQAGSIRKQVLSDWDLEMYQCPEGEFVMDPTMGVDLTASADCVLIQNSVRIRQYESYCNKRNPGSVKPVKPSRGYLFLTGSGLKKVLERTSKKYSDEFKEALFEALAIKPDAPKIKAPESPKVERVEPVPPLKAVTEIPMEVRNFHYQALQTLLTQLQEITNPVLREVAILAAETATGKDFTELRRSFGPQPTPAPKPSKVKEPSPEHPLFVEGTYYSLTAIGEKAGGYSAVQAGKAANVVGTRLNLTPEQLRRTQLPFNLLVTLRDTNNRERPMFRFNRSFSNKVIQELRSNPGFSPRPVVRDLVPFSTGKEVNLSAPLNLNEENEEIETEVDSDHIEAIILTLQSEQH